MCAAAGRWLHTHAAGGPRLPAVIFIRRRSRRNPSFLRIFLLGLHVCGLLLLLRRRRGHGVGDAGSAASSGTAERERNPTARRPGLVVLHLQPIPELPNPHARPPGSELPTQPANPRRRRASRCPPAPLDSRERNGEGGRDLWIERGRLICWLRDAKMARKRGGSTKPRTATGTGGVLSRGKSAFP